MSRMRPSNNSMASSVLLISSLLVISAVGVQQAAAIDSFADRIADVQPRVVKIYGAGGFQRLEAYQSGFLISPDGYVLTVWSYVLDTEIVTVTLNDGRKFEAELKGYDPTLEIAVMKIDVEGLPFFDLEAAVELVAGDRVLAFSNLYGVATGNEPVSVLHGSVCVKSNLVARSKTFRTPYQGPVYILDAMTNNPGAAGGALTDRRGRFAGILGKELKNAMNNTWLNYAIPADELVVSVNNIISGKIIPLADPDDKPVDPLTLSMLGVVLVPDVVNKTPPFIDRIQPGSAADKAGLKADDLVLFVNNRIASSCKSVKAELTFIDRDDPVRLLIQRDRQLIEVELRASD